MDIPFGSSEYGLSTFSATLLQTTEIDIFIQCFIIILRCIVSVYNQSYGSVKVCPAQLVNVNQEMLPDNHCKNISLIMADEFGYCSAQG